MTVLSERITTNDNAFIQDEFTKSLLSRSLKYVKTGYPVHFIGPSGSGKTSIAIALANKLKRPVMLMHGNHELDNKDLIGSFSGYTSSKVVDQYVRSVYKKDETVTESWKDGRLLEAVKNGYTLIYDEFSRSRPATNNIFLSILEEGILPLYGLKSNRPYVKVHPKFNIIFTSNPNEYAGVYQTQDALLDRLITLYVCYKSKQEETFILSEKIGIEENEATIISSLVQDVRKEFHERHGAPSIRTTIQIAKIAKNDDIPIKGSNQDFLQLCIDLLSNSVVQGLEITYEDASDLIRELCKKTT
ncbi:gas vesicle protein GvpN [Gracilibacillus massiliensis]|uniref:gas vesicle protein GvpN n=1 Tax=Gracilibacillus massiliensis TaxID=1564956 RepID=UPI00071CEE52|nr:gas vesicle protein GvpN [Gracilibacillus massiliensis]